MADYGIKYYISAVLIGVGGVVALYWLQLRNFLLFHGLVEMFSIFVAFGVFTVAWNTRGELDDAFLAVLGVAYLYIGGVDLLHTLAYKGMGVFPEAGADLPTQLWILGRYMEGASLAGAAVIGYVSIRTDSPFGIHWERELPALTVAYGAVVAVGLWSIFTADLFPTAYVAGSGLTPFKVLSEYVIIGLLGVALVVLVKQRHRFDGRVFSMVAVAIVLSAGSELAFTFYVDVYGISNAVGHFFKLGSFGLVYLAIVKTGITDPQRTLYRSLASSEAEARKFKQAVEHSGHAVLITDPQGTIQYVNSAFETLTGYRAEEIEGENPRILQSGEHDPAFFQDLWATIRSGEVWENQIVNERKNGERYVANQTISPITDEDGEIQHFVAVNTDITEQKEQEQELLQRYEALFSSIRDAIVVTDTDGRITNANPAFSELFGYELSDVEGSSIERLYDADEEFDRVWRAIQEHTGDQRVTKSVDLRKRSGQAFPGEITVFYLRDADGEVVGYITLVTDVSDRRNRIHQLQVIDRILRHNLRNALNVIEGHAEALAKGKAADVDESADRIIATTEDLMETVSKEHEITKFLTEEPSLETVDLAAAVESVVPTLRTRFPSATISVSLPEQSSVLATPAIPTALSEVIENAILHADRPEPTVEVTAERVDDTVAIHIADTGPTIPEMERKVLTREREIEPLYHGSGLGLWLVNLVVEQSDGVLTFDENEPRGNVITIHLPVAAKSAEASSSRQTS